MEENICQCARLCKEPAARAHVVHLEECPEVLQLDQSPTGEVGDAHLQKLALGLEGKQTGIQSVHVQGSMVVGHVGEEDGSGALRGVLLEAEPLAVLLQGELRDVRP